VTMVSHSSNMSANSGVEEWFS